MLVTHIYKVTESFPKCETYGLVAQIRRAAVSIPSNIAEGQAHFSRREFNHFLHHSRGSLAELETQLIISERLDYVSHAQLAGPRNRPHYQRTNQFAVPAQGRLASHAPAGSEY